MPRNTKLPVSAYDPQLLNALLQAVTGPVVIESDQPKELYSLQYTLRTLRRQLEREGHPAWEQAAKVQVGLYDKADNAVVPHPVTKEFNFTPAKLVIKLRGSRFSSLLTAAGIATDEVPIPPPVSIGDFMLPDESSAEEDLTRLLNLPLLPPEPEPEPEGD